MRRCKPFILKTTIPLQTELEKNPQRIDQLLCKSAMFGGWGFSSMVANLCFKSMCKTLDSFLTPQEKKKKKRNENCYANWESQTNHFRVSWICLFGLILFPGGIDWYRNGNNTEWPGFFFFFLFFFSSLHIGSCIYCKIHGNQRLFPSKNGCAKCLMILCPLSQ